MMVSRAGLGRLTQIAAGTHGMVFKVEEFRLPGDSTPLVYKESTQDQARSAQAAVGLWTRLSSTERADLGEYTAWPRGLVEDTRGMVCGLLMPLIPQEFFCRQADPDTGQMTFKPREMSWLIATQAQRSSAQVELPDIDRTERQILLAKLIYAIGRLHKQGWVFGDLSFRKVVFGLNPPRVYVNCDGAAGLADLTRAQAHTPFWVPPECVSGQQKLQDTATDVYKLGLAILRCLTPGRGAASSTAPGRLAGVLDPEGIDLVTRALSADRCQRPTAKDLYVYLYRCL